MELDVTDHTEEEFRQKLSMTYNQEALKMFNKIRLYKNNEFAFKEVINGKTFKENAKVVKELIKLLERYQVKYSHKQQFLGDFFEKLLNIGVKQESGHFFTPVPIARFIINSIPFEGVIKYKIQNKEKEYPPKCIYYACGSGYFLTEAMDRIQKNLDSNFNILILSPKQKRQVAFQKLFGTVFKATGNSTTVIFGIKRKKNTIAIINKLIKYLTKTKLDFNYNQNENVISKYCGIIEMTFEAFTTKITTDQTFKKDQLQRLRFFLLTNS